MKRVLCLANALPPMAGGGEARHLRIACCLPGLGCGATVLVAGRG